MGHLFLDIETYVAKGNEESAINPYLPESMVIMISYNYYEGFRPPIKSEIRPPKFLKEWESDEKTILSDFLAFLRTLQRKDPNLRIHGFNILEFDIPFLFGRMKFHSLADNRELHTILFGRVGTDMMHLSSLLSNSSRDREQLWGLEQKEVNKFFGFQVREGTDEKCSRFYDEKKYEKIEEYCKNEFHFEQLLDAFYLYVRDLMEGKGHGLGGFFEQ